MNTPKLSISKAALVYWFTSVEPKPMTLDGKEYEAVSEIYGQEITQARLIRALNASNCPYFTKETEGNKTFYVPSEQGRSFYLTNLQHLKSEE